MKKDVDVIEELFLESEEKMEKTVEVAKHDFSTIRTGRATASMFEKVVVDYYGAPTPLQQLGSINIPEARTVIITPYDKSAMGGMETALRDSDLGVNPTNNGDNLRIVLPALTEERRRDYIKLARTKGEDAKISIRSVRRHTKETIEKAVKDGDIGEDEGARAEKELEAMTKRYADQVDVALESKEKELITV